MDTANLDAEINKYERMCNKIITEYNILRNERIRTINMYYDRLMLIGIRCIKYKDFDVDDLNKEEWDGLISFLDQYVNEKEYAYKMRQIERFKESIEKHQNILKMYGESIGEQN